MRIIRMINHPTRGAYQHGQNVDRNGWFEDQVRQEKECRSDDPLMTRPDSVPVPRPNKFRTTSTIEIFFLGLYPTRLPSMVKWKESTMSRTPRSQMRLLTVFSSVFHLPLKIARNTKVRAGY